MKRSKLAPSEYLYDLPDESYSNEVWDGLINVVAAAQRAGRGSRPLDVQALKERYLAEFPYSDEAWSGLDDAALRAYRDARRVR